MPTLETIGKFFTVVPDPMLLVDSEGVIVLASHNACTLFGYGPDELTGKAVNCLLPEYYRFSHEEHLKAYFQASTVRSMGIGLELLALRADGSEFSVEISLSPYKPGDAVFALAAIRDITERKHLEEARSESYRQKEIAEERANAAQMLANRNEALRAIFDASPIGIYTFTKEGRVDRWNQSAERIFGYSASEVLGTIIWDLDKALEVEKHPSAELLAQLSRGEGFRNLQLKRRRKDGTTIDISLNAAALHDPSGGDAGYVRMCADITERATMEQQLRHAQKMEAVGQLTGGIAHDFNNLLSIIICNLELLRERLASGSEILEMSEMALDASLRGADLIKRLLAFSRKQNLDPKDIEVNQLVKSMMSLLARSLGEQVEIILEMAPETWPAVADPIQLQTALANLATNARDAMPKGGKLVIQTSNVTLDESYVQQFADLKAGEYVMVTVSDSGEGMSGATVERAIDPFFTTKPAGMGTGLGLSMVFGFVKQSGGHLRIYSELGLGTTVRLYLPRSADGQPSPDLAAEAPAQPKPGGARVLIVEDNRDLAKSAHRVLSEAGFRVSVATTASEALAVLHGPEPCEVLFTDIILPQGVNGIELSQEALKLRPEIKILFASGFSEAALRESGKAVVTGHFLAKPYRKEELIARIRGLVEGADARPEDGEESASGAQE